MAHINCVTPRALRFYQQKGVLEPRHTNDESGYRYYDIMQSTKLDMISNLQAIGFSIEEIKEVDDAKDMGLLHEKVVAHLERIERQQRELEIAKDIASGVRDGIDLMRSHLICDQIVLEQIPVRHVIEFAFPEDGFAGSPQCEFNASERWEWVVHWVKRQVVDRGWPISLCNNVHYLLDKDRALEPGAWAYRPFVLVDEGYGECLAESRQLRGGQYLVFYSKTGYAKDGTSVDGNRWGRLFDYTRAKGFEIDGDLVCEALFRYQRFFDESVSVLCRYCMPVRSRT